MRKNKITKLTFEQENYLPKFREEWLARGLCVEPIDRKKAAEAVENLYLVNGFNKPKILFFSSPLMCLLAKGVFLQKNKQIDLGDQLRGLLEDQLWDQLKDQLWDQLGGQLRDQLERQLRYQPWGQLWGKLREQLGVQLGDQLRDQPWDQLRDQLGVQLRVQLGVQLRVQLWDQLKDQLRYQMWADLLFIGGWDSFWLAFYEFCRRIGASYKKETEQKFQAYKNYSENAGIMLAYKDFAFVSDRPSEIHFDDDRKLHNEKGMALKFRDGWGVSAWHGKRVPDHWITDRESLDPNEIMKVDDVELRAVGCEIVGWAKMLEVLQSKVIDDSGNPDIGQLIELKLDGLPEPELFLKAECPRNGTIVEGVPKVSDIDGSPINTALAAQAWRVGDTLSTYQHPPIDLVGKFYEFRISREHNPFLKQAQRVRD